MPDQNLFEDNVNKVETQPQQQAPVTNPNDLFSDQLAVIKNENGEQKYETVEKAIEALQHSQQYIPELKGKLSAQEQLINELKAKLEATEKVQDIIQKQTSPQENDASTNQSSFGEKEIADLVEKQLQRKAQESVASENANKVSNALKQRFGDSAQAEVHKKAKELGITPSELGELSKKSPAMVLSLFGEKIGNASPTTNSFHIPADPKAPEPLAKPSKSLLSGARASEQAEFMKKIKEEVYRKYDVKV